jgi:hypothetical protein
MCRPTSESTAGRSVIDASTAVATANAEEYPSDVTSGIPATSSVSSAITTVVPAKTMALPEVATASAIESFSSIPCARFARCRLTRKSA